MRSLALLCCAAAIAAAGQCPPNAQAAPATTIASLQILGTAANSAGEVRDIAQEFAGKPFHNDSDLRELIREAFQDRGYYKAQVSEPEVHPMRDHSRDQVFAVVNVNGGQRYRIQLLAFSYAKEVLTVEQMRALIPVQSGDWFSISKLREGLRKINGAFLERGYINFVAVPKIEADDELAALSMNVELDSGGKQFTVRSVRVMGGTPDLKSRVTDEAKKLEGGFLSPAVSERLRQLGVCPEQQMTIQKNETDGTLDIVLNLDGHCPVQGCV
jgi:outer membrane protein assembly factor BamA